MLCRVPRFVPDSTINTNKGIPDLRDKSLIDAKEGFITMSCVTHIAKSNSLTPKFSDFFDFIENYILIFCFSRCPGFVPSIDRFPSFFLVISNPEQNNTCRSITHLFANSSVIMTRLH